MDSSLHIPELGSEDRYTEDSVRNSRRYQTTSSLAGVSAVESIEGVPSSRTAGATHPPSSYRYGPPGHTALYSSHSVTPEQDIEVNGADSIRWGNQHQSNSFGYDPDFTSLLGSESNNTRSAPPRWRIPEQPRRLVNHRRQPSSEWRSRPAEKVPPPPKPTAENQPMVEVAPGEFLRLRGADETWRAIRCDFYMPSECVCCATTIFCILDADFVLCPDCRVVSPMGEGSCDSKKKKAGGGGVGLGFGMTDLATWQAEIAQELTN